MKMKGYKSSKANQWMDNSTGTLKDYQQIKKNPWHGYLAQVQKKWSLITAVKDQALNIRYHQRNIIKLQIDSKCRMCYKAEKHIKHTVMGCETLASSEYTNGHNKVVGYIHWTVCKHMVLQVTDKCYENIPIRVININSTTIVWDIPVITDWNILANQPDIVLHDRKREDLPTDQYSHTRWF